MPLRRGGNLFRAALFHADDDPVYNAQLCRDLSRRRDRRRLAKRSDERVSGVRAEPRHQAVAAVAPGPPVLRADDVQWKLAKRREPMRAVALTPAQRTGSSTSAIGGCFRSNIGCQRASRRSPPSPSRKPWWIPKRSATPST